MNATAGLLFSTRGGSGRWLLPKSVRVYVYFCLSGISHYCIFYFLNVYFFKSAMPSRLQKIHIETFLMKCIKVDGKKLNQISGQFFVVINLSVQD